MSTRGHQKRMLPRTGYPRRRALSACLICRERKRKCDNLRPTCSSCQQIGAPCEYTKQDSSSFDAASLRILDQLSLIKGLQHTYSGKLQHGAQYTHL
ncbi:Regulator of drug sensitivity 1 like protein [Verticillium longisporum]|uniref:Regulator of drug sensitivity 1 like protein n=1 Tax=Verticillium longisporum TaxID=100787 RepID=A0A8I2YZU3_VERLO|nr:Regulator of drug sensitivity 1 like protein [Verticillium longisporum]KAG7139258.1 Regulator of drug sensitivity 1 like protein [Verticillium longisporum]